MQIPMNVAAEIMDIEPTSSGVVVVHVRRRSWRFLKWLACEAWRLAGEMGIPRWDPRLWFGIAKMLWTVVRM